MCQSAQLIRIRMSQAKPMQKLEYVNVASYRTITITRRVYVKTDNVWNVWGVNGTCQGPGL